MPLQKYSLEFSLSEMISNIVKQLALLLKNLILKSLCENIILFIIKNIDFRINISSSSLQRVEEIVLESRRLLKFGKQLLCHP